VETLEIAAFAGRAERSVHQIKASVSQHPYFYAVRLKARCPLTWRKPPIGDISIIVRNRDPQVFPQEHCGLCGATGTKPKKRPAGGLSFDMLLNQDYCFGGVVVCGVVVCGRAADGADGADGTGAATPEEVL
jgi:hypothetical protein